MKLSIIIPTIGRPSLYPLLKSIEAQINPLIDEVIVGEDGDTKAEKLVQQFGYRYFSTKKDSCYGSLQRTIAISLAKGTHLAFLDDDDQITPDWRSSIELLSNPNIPNLFRMRHENLTLWTTKEILIGNIAQQIFICPNDPNKLGQWSRKYEQDFDFIKSTIDKYDGAVNWVDKIIAIHGISEKVDGDTSKGPIA